MERGNLRATRHFCLGKSRFCALGVVVQFAESGAVAEAKRGSQSILVTARRVLRIERFRIDGFAQGGFLIAPGFLVCEDLPRYDARERPGETVRESPLVGRATVRW